MDLEGDLVERLAEAAHDVYCRALRGRGYRYGPKTDDERRTSRALVPYPELPEDLKDQSRATARDIPAKLAAVGCEMAPARGGEPPFEFSPQDLEHLSRAEHRRWRAAKARAGWRRGPTTDPSRRTHEALVPWEELSESQREKDRDMVRGIPAILAAAGYTIVPSPGGGPKAAPGGEEAP